MPTAPAAAPPGTAATPAGSPPTGFPSRPDPSDPATEVWTLVERAQAGESEAFGLIYDRYLDTVFRFVYFRVGNRQLAEDLTSDTFLRALKRIGSFTWQGRDLGAWLVTIARNLVADHFKSGRYRLEVTTGDVLDADREDRGPEGSPEAAVVDHITNVALLTAVKQLNPEQQECIVLRFLQGFSVAETARAMGKNEGAIKALQYRAVRALARLLTGAASSPDLARDDHFRDFATGRPVTGARHGAFLRVRPVVVPARPDPWSDPEQRRRPRPWYAVHAAAGRWDDRGRPAVTSEREVPAVDSDLFSRRRAERFAQLLDEANGGRRHHVRSRRRRPARRARRGRPAAPSPTARPSRWTPSSAPACGPCCVATAEREGIGAADRGGRAAPAPPRPPAGAGCCRRSTARRARARGAILVGVAAGAIAVSGISAASENAVPGDALYGMKRSTERAQLALASSDLSRGQLFLDFARTRLDEAATLRGDRPASARCSTTWTPTPARAYGC